MFQEKSSTHVFALRAILAAVMIILAAVLRIVPHPWNFTPIDATALFSGAMFRDRRVAFLFPLIALFAGDLFVGFHRLIPVVYASFLLSVCIGTGLANRRGILRVGGAVFLGALQFFLVTNFAVWQLFGTYPHTPTGPAMSPELLAKYEPVIGLEVHVQLLTKTKIFCGCSTRFGDPPNSNVCPVCLGLPGTLPVLNKRAVEMAMRAALAINCTVHEHSRFASKNYFYPDLPKGYQISQYELSLATGGWLEIEIQGEKKRIGITRLHLEEDAGKSLHDGFSQSATKTYIDYNRCGTPLSEIVSEPDMRTPEEAYAYLTTLRQILLYTGVSDCNMEEGSLRCDANVSVRLR